MKSSPWSPNRLLIDRLLIDRVLVDRRRQAINRQGIHRQARQATNVPMEEKQKQVYQVYNTAVPVRKGTVPFLVVLWYSSAVAQ